MASFVPAGCILMIFTFQMVIHTETNTQSHTHSRNHTKMVCNMCNTMEF